VIEVQDVTIERAGRVLCQGLNWQMPDPGAYLLLGPNASGKSLLCALLAGNLRPQRGNVLIDGRPVYGRLGAVCDCWHARAETALVEDEPLVDYLEQELINAGGNANMLTPVWPLLELKLGGRRTRLTQLSHGQALLAQVALAACVPARLVILDGHLSYLDPALAHAAGQLFQSATPRTERFTLLTAAKLADGGFALRQVFGLDGALPLTLTALEWEQPSPVFESLERRLTVYPESRLGPAWQLASGRSFAVTGAREGGWEVKLLGSLEQMLAELREQGIALARLEWNAPPQE
jgi:energy-coupling factor transporter ATP-binding protein EcfA2